MLRVNRQGKSRLQWDKVVDSGTRTAFDIGSQRDTQDGKGRYDLIPTSMLHRLAQHYENGALKYGDNNWQKGQPLHQYYNSAMRHLQAIRDADLSEDHFAAAIWNVAAMIHHIDAMLDGTLPKELDSFGIVDKVMDIKAQADFAEYTFPAKPHDFAFPSGVHRVVVSGAYDPSLPLPNYTPPEFTTGKVVWDKDRFDKEWEKNEKVQRKKYDPEKY